APNWRPTVGLAQATMGLSRPTITRTKVTQSSVSQGWPWPRRDGATTDPTDMGGEDRARAAIRRSLRGHPPGVDGQGCCHTWSVWSACGVWRVQLSAAAHPPAGGRAGVVDRVPAG